LRIGRDAFVLNSQKLLGSIVAIAAVKELRIPAPQLKRE